MNSILIVIALILIFIIFFIATLYKKVYYLKNRQLVQYRFFAGERIIDPLFINKINIVKTDGPYARYYIQIHLKFGEELTLYAQDSGATLPEMNRFALAKLDIVRELIEINPRIELDSTLKEAVFRNDLPGGIKNSIDQHGSKPNYYP